MTECDTSADAPTVAFIAKMFVAEIGPTRTEQHIGFCRIFSGSLTNGSQVHVLECADQKVLHSVELFTLMGRSADPVSSAGAGSICGIGGLTGQILKTGTLSTHLYDSKVPGLANLDLQATPIVCVAVETQDPTEMHILINGLKLLNDLDPGVEFYVQATGEHILAVAGEVHLQRCLKDLRERFAKVDFEVSEPIVPFRETVVNDDGDSQHATPVAVCTSNKGITLRIRAVPLPKDLLDLIAAVDDNCLFADDLDPLFLDEFSLLLADHVNTLGCDVGARFWAFGPKQARNNILINGCSDLQLDCAEWQTAKFSLHTSAGSDAENHAVHDSVGAASEDAKVVFKASDAYHSLKTGFENAVNAGPLCKEPMSGIAFVMDAIEIDSEASAEAWNQFGPISGQLISAMMRGCHQAVLAHNPRLVEPMYLCQVQTNMESLSNAYSVLSKRRAKVVDEDVQEGTYIFQITSTLPVIESFGLADEMRGDTSGSASVQLKFDNWALLQDDPFYEPKSQDELEEFGVDGDPSNNVAVKLMNKIRRRKGLSTQEKIVFAADKQRTRSRKK